MEKDKAVKSGPAFFIRFSVNQRVQHIILMVSFIVLAVTGLAQRYYTSGWAEWVIMGLGGIEFTRLVHRFFGLVFTLIILYHLGYLVYMIFRRHARPTMVPTLKDFRDAVSVLKYSLGFAERPPKYGRFDYNQKFEYWGLVFGGMVIIVSGFVLAFPLAVTRILPGQVVAAAVDFHGFEATLAVLTIIIWHLYDVIFKPGIFPADTSIFTGKISKERMLHEHPLEYAELTGADVPAETGEPLPDESTSEQSPA
jgi:formate dehydrogenase subunit gamma